MKPRVTSQPSVVTVLDLNLLVGKKASRLKSSEVIYCTYGVGVPRNGTTDPPCTACVRKSLNKSLYLLSEGSPFPQSVLQCSLLGLGHATKPGPPLPQ